MKSFYYRARDEEGTIRTGEIESENKPLAARKLQNQGLKVITLKIVEANHEILYVFHRGADKRYLTLFCRQLAVLIEMQSLYTSLQAIASQKNEARITQVLQSLCHEIESGYNLSESMEKQKGFFPPRVVQLVRVGEMSGRLPEVLKRLADYLEEETTAEQKFQTALLYPTLLSIATLIAFAVMIFFVLPGFMALFVNLQVPLPLLTQIVMVVGQLLRETGVYLAILGIVALLALVYFYRHERFGWRIARYMLRMPLFGTLWINVNWFNILTALAVMQRSGLRLSESLPLAAETADNRFVRRILYEARKKIENGGSLAAALNSSFLPPLILQLIDTGERTGHLDEMLQKGADYARLVATDRLNKIQALAEPVMILVVGLFVIVLVLAVVLPILDVIDNVM